MSVTKITRKLYTNSRMELESFMHTPTGTYTGKDRGTLNINTVPLLFLRYRKPKNISEEYDYTKAAYKITTRNLYDVVRFFNVIMKWLFDDKYRDLFLTNDEGDLVFNADYSKLSVSTHRGDYDQCIMQAIPTIISIGDKKYEGVHLYINTTKYCISLTYQEVSILFGILKDFSFTEEALLLLNMYDYIMKNNAISETDWWSNTKPTPFD